MTIKQAKENALKCLENAYMTINVSDSTTWRYTISENLDCAVRQLRVSDDEITYIKIRTINALLRSASYMLTKSKSAKAFIAGTHIMDAKNYLEEIEKLIKK